MLVTPRPPIGRGLLIGKFLPPHAGHVHLIEFAKRFADQLTVLVCSLANEPIPGASRHAWMTEMFPGVRVVHVTDENPQYPEEHPDFWVIWRDTIRRAAPDGFELLFASEPYGIPLSEVLGCRFIPVDVARSSVPISGTKIRENPLAHFDMLAPPVRAYFVKRIAIVGPESTGKSTLAAKLAAHYQTIFVPEYARALIELHGNRVDYPLIDTIGRGQRAAEESLARQANRLLFCDTDQLTTTVWSELLFQRTPTWLMHEAMSAHYALTLLCCDDTPWVDDPQRFLPDGRADFLHRCETQLKLANRNYVRINGDYETRFEAAKAAVDALLVDLRLPNEAFQSSSTSQE